MEKYKVAIIKDTGKQLQEISLDHAKKIMLEILIEFDHICKNNNLTYWLDYGTLLGAIRHKGFIPWDDDIDVGMPRDDYEKFLKIYKNELPFPLFLQTRESDPEYSQYYAKIRNTNTLYIEDSEKGKDIKYNQGIFIDIFPLNYIDARLRLLHPFFRFLGKFFLKNRFYIKYFDVDLYKYYIKIFNKLHYRSNNMVVRGPETFSVLKNIDKNDIFPLKELAFENYTFPVPCNYDKYLTELYGDYMIPLLIEEREKARHSHEIYIIQ